MGHELRIGEMYLARSYGRRHDTSKDPPVNILEDNDWNPYFGFVKKPRDDDPNRAADSALRDRLLAGDSDLGDVVIEVAAKGRSDFSGPYFANVTSISATDFEKHEFPCSFVNEHLGFADHRLVLARVMYDPGGRLHLRYYSPEGERKFAILEAYPTGIGAPSIDIEQRQQEEASLTREMIDVLEPGDFLFARIVNEGVINYAQPVINIRPNECRGSKTITSATWVSGVIPNMKIQQLPILSCEESKEHGWYLRGYIKAPEQDKKRFFKEVRVLVEDFPMIDGSHFYGKPINVKVTERGDTFLLAEPLTD